MKRINESEYGDMHLDYDMRRFAGYDKWKKKQDEIEQLKQDAKVDKNAAWKVADGRLKHKQDNLNMAFDDRKKHQQDWLDNGKKGVKQGLKNGEFKYHGKKHKWPSNNPVPFQRSDDEKEVLAKFDKEPFFNNETNESKNSMKKNVVKLNENTLRQIVAESVKKVLKESDINNRDFDMSPEAVSYRNEISDGNPKRPLRSLLRTISQCIDTMREVHNGNENFKYYEFEQAEHQAKHAIEKLDELL